MNCPFCGGQEVEFRVLHGVGLSPHFQVRCACGSAGPWRHGRDSAREAWEAVAAIVSAARDVASNSYCERCYVTLDAGEDKLCADCRADRDEARRAENLAVEAAVQRDMEARA